MSGIEVIYASEIKPVSSILGVFKGTESFCINNPYFNIPGMPNITPEQYMEKKQKTAGWTLNNIQIGVKSKSNEDANLYTRRFVIGYNENADTRKPFYVARPYDTTQILKAYKHKVNINPNSFSALDKGLSGLDYILCEAINAGIGLKLGDIDMRNYAELTDNRAFFNKWAEDLTNYFKAKVNGKKLKGQITVSDEYIHSLTHTPFFITFEGKKFPVTDTDDPNTKIVSPLASLYEFCRENNLLRTLESNWQCIIKSNCTMIPTIINIRYKNKKDEIISTINSRFSIYTEQEEKDPNKKPFTTYIVKLEEGKHKITHDDMLSLWGSNRDDVMTNTKDPRVKKGLMHDLKLYLLPTVSYGIYKQGNPYIEWRVDKINVMPKATNSNKDYTDGDTFNDKDRKDAAVLKSMKPQTNFKKPDDYLQNQSYGDNVSLK